MKRAVFLSVIFGIGLVGCSTDNTNNSKEVTTDQPMTSQAEPCYGEDATCPPGHACINNECVEVEKAPDNNKKQDPIKQDDPIDDTIRCDEFVRNCDETTCDHKDSCWQVCGFLPNVICLNDGRIVDAICEDWSCDTGTPCDVTCRDAEVCKDGKCVNK